MHPIKIAGAALALTAALSAGIVIGASGQKSTVTNLFQGALDDDFTPGREVLVDLVEIPPDTSLDRHWHPGEEFHYYLEGDPQVQLGDGPTVQPRLGTVGHVGFKAVHRAGAGAAGAKILVFRVHTRGEPWRYREDEHPDDRDAVRR